MFSGHLDLWPQCLLGHLSHCDPFLVCECILRRTTSLTVLI